MKSLQELEQIREDLEADHCAAYLVGEITRQEHDDALRLDALLVESIKLARENKYIFEIVR